jgi:hypothetical protein
LTEKSRGAWFAAVGHTSCPPHSQFRFVRDVDGVGVPLDLRNRVRCEFSPSPTVLVRPDKDDGEA